MDSIKRRDSFWGIIVALAFTLWTPPSIWGQGLVEYGLLYGGLTYQIQIGDEIVGGFVSVSGIGSENEIIEETITDSSTGVEIVQKNPGRLTWLNIVLKQGISSDTYLWEWRKQVEDGNFTGAQKNFSIIAINSSSDPDEVVAQWNFENGWPMKISAPNIFEVQVPVPELGVYTIPLPIETLVIAHEGYERIILEQN